MRVSAVRLGSRAGYVRGESSDEARRPVSAGSAPTRQLDDCTIVLVQWIMFAVDPADPTPLYAQLDRSIRAAIASGQITVGDRLPTVDSSRSIFGSTPTLSPRCTRSSSAPECSPTQRGIGTFVQRSPTPARRRARRDRERELRPLVDRLLADASAIGISLHEIVQYYQEARDAQYQGETLKCQSTKIAPCAHAPPTRTIALRLDVRINIISVIILLVFSRDRRSRLPCASRNPPASHRRGRRLHPCAVAQDREAVGARRRPAPRQVRRAARDRDCSGSSRSSRRSRRGSISAIITTNFNAEETLTSDTVPVNVDAVLFWMVYDPEKAALEVQDYARAVSWAAQTALRDIIGRTSLTDLLRGREQIEAGAYRSSSTSARTPWGVTVQSVEMRDVIIPASLQDAMSREAQASREKQARIILGQAEVEIAHLFQEASKSYHDNPTALHLRAMNILYEGLKEKGALMLVPSTAVESMGLGGLLGAAAVRQTSWPRRGT